MNQSTESPMHLAMSTTLVACTDDHKGVILGLVDGLGSSLENADVQLLALQAVSSLLQHNCVYDASLIHRVTTVAFEVMHTHLKQLMPCVIGITKSWTLDILRSVEVGIVYAGLNLLCHLTTTANPMGIVCKQVIMDEHLIPLVHHAHAVAQSLHEWCMFQPLHLRATTPYFSNAEAYNKLSQILSV